MHSITDVSKQLGIKAHTLRYYEKEGIIEPDRNSYGVRKYRDSHIKWLKFVKKLRETEMPIAQIKEYVQLVQEGDHTTLKRLHLLEDHRSYIQNQIKELKETEEMLDKKVRTYKEWIVKQDS